MSDVIHKLTLQYLLSVHTPDYIGGNWLINPEIPKGFIPGDSRNWKVEKDKIVPTTEEEKAKWDDEHPVPEPVPTIEERLLVVENELSTVKDDVSALKTASKIEEPST